MLPLLTCSQIRSLEKKLIEKYKLDESNLIDNVAQFCYKEIEKNIIDKDVLFVCGKGNNASDALSLALLSLEKARTVSIFLCFDSANEENIKRQKMLPESVFVTAIGDNYDTIVDGIFGFGFRGDVSEEIRETIDIINKSRATVISLDVPSAFLVKADYTYTFTSHKVELYDPFLRSNCGSIKLFNPGFREEEIVAEDSFLLLDDDYSIPPFGLDAYKKTRGRVLVLGGSKKYRGAPLLSALSAFHAGAGMVTIYSKKEVIDSFLPFYPSILYREEDDGGCFDYDSIVVGPGWDEGRKDILYSLIEENKKLVIDADAIKLIGKKKLGGKAIITPHIGEFNTLMKNLSLEKSSSIFSDVKNAAKRTEGVIVLKSSIVIISDGEKLFVYDGSNNSLGVAGSGDVLGGIIASFLAILPPLEAAINGTILHQKVGRRLKNELGYYTAEDIIKEIGRER